MHYQEPYSNSICEANADSSAAGRVSLRFTQPSGSLRPQHCTLDAMKFHTNQNLRVLYPIIFGVNPDLALVWHYEIIAGAWVEMEVNGHRVTSHTVQPTGTIVEVDGVRFRSDAKYIRALKKPV